MELGSEHKSLAITRDDCAKIKDENINFDKYMANSILRIYRDISMDILTQNIGEAKIDQNLWKCWKISKKWFFFFFW